MACAIPSLVRNCRLHCSSQPVFFVVLAILELLLEPAFEALPTGGALLTLLAEPGQHRRERFLVRRGAALARIAGVPDELGERAQAVRGNLLVAFPESARQQVAPRRLLQRRQQLGATARHALGADVDARIQARAAGLDHAQRRILRTRRRGEQQRRQQPQPLHDRTTRLSCSRSRRSWYATISTARMNGTPSAPTTSVNTDRAVEMRNRSARPSSGVSIATRNNDST